MYAQKIELPLEPGVPVGSKYATRPDFFGKASYTFTNVYQHKPYSVQFRRASDIQILTSLWRKDDGGDPLVWTVDKIKSDIGLTILATFINQNLATNIQLTKFPLTMNTNAGLKVLNKQADVIDFGKAWFDEKQMANIF